MRSKIINSVDTSQIVLNAPQFGVALRVCKLRAEMRLECEFGNAATASSLTGVMNAWRPSANGGRFRLASPDDAEAVIFEFADDLRAVSTPGPTS